jgi:AcrR family transcriptional regulator
MNAVAASRRQGHHERLLDGAMQCLREKGYARTTARDLVAASGTNLASIGYHFGSKEALLDQAIARGFDQWAEEVEGAMFAAPEASAAERFAISLEAMIGRFDELRPYLVAFVEALPRALRSPELRETLAAAYARCREAGARMASSALAGERMEISDTQARDLASVGMAICDGIMIQWLLDPDATPGAAQVVESLGLALATVQPGRASA